MPLIDSEEVSSIFRDCLLQDTNEIEAGLPKKGVKWVKVSGIMSNYGFVKSRCEEHAPKILEMLMNLPEEFQEDIGGGWSFLMACRDKSGDQWTGLHKIMEELFCLGMAIGRVICLAPRKLWSALPGSMPYYEITKEVVEIETLDGPDEPPEPPKKEI